MTLLVAPDDGIIDYVAVARVAHGADRMALTWREMEVAIRQMRCLGLTRTEMCERLEVPRGCAPAFD
jgi:hypothetical protein